MELKRLIALVPVVVVLIALVLLGVADGAASIAGTPIPGNEAVSGANEVGNPDSANATITIIMRTPPLPDK